MTKLTMHRNASDNKYLHKDFHCALNFGIKYIDEKYGENAVDEYLRQFVFNFYGPLKREIIDRGLIAIKEHYEAIYKIEETDIKTNITDSELIIEVDISPAVSHIKEKDFIVSDKFYKTVATVNSALCENTPYESEVLVYDEKTGRSIQRFFRRQQ